MHVFCETSGMPPNPHANLAIWEAQRLRAADLSMWGADLDLKLQPKQAKNTSSIKKVTISQRSSNKYQISKICKLQFAATSEIEPCHERVLLMSRTLVLSPAMRHVSGAPNLPDLKGSQHQSYKLCTNFANIFGILHDLTVLIVRPPYILCTFFLHGSKTKESSSSQDSTLWTRALAAPNKRAQVINRDGRWWESGQVNKQHIVSLINHEDRDNIMTLVLAESI